MNITPQTKLGTLMTHAFGREVLDAFGIPLERSWTLAQVCDALDIDLDDLIVELEMAESENVEDDDFDEDDWAYAG